MAAAAAVGGQDSKKRLSKAVKKKSKKQSEVPVEEETTPATTEETPAPAAAAKEEVPPAEAVSEAAAEAEGAKAAATKVKKVKSKARRLEEMEAAADEEPVEPRGVIYVGHIPDGFFELQMKKFFSQFGDVTRLRISRTAKNAKSKGYGFVEFKEESVATIVAETMHKYMLFGKTLVCHLMPKEKQHPMLFKNWNKKMTDMSGVRRQKFKSQYNERPTIEVDGQQILRRSIRQEKRGKTADRKLQGVLANLGVDYSLDGVLDDSAKGSGLAASLSKAAAEKPPPPSPAKGPAAAAEGSTDTSGPKKKKRKAGAK